ncbi:DUF6406 domain-containing protein [Streptomyces sp. NPDC002520]
MISRVPLRRGVPFETENAWFAVRHVYAPEGLPPTVYLIVDAAGEREFELGIGDTFSVHDETWIVERVDGLGTGGNWRVILTKVEQ